MTRRLALLGAGGHGKVVADAALCAGWHEVVFYDDAWPRVQASGTWPVVGASEQLVRDLPTLGGVIVTIGRNATRLDKQRWLQSLGAPLVSIIHPAATISRFAALGPGCVVMASAVVNVDASIGQACIINTGATVDHDCQLADGVHISPGAHLSGQVNVGEASWVGVGAVVRQGLIIGRGVMVGAGAVVVKPVPDDLTVIGNPARPLVTRELPGSH